MCDQLTGAQEITIVALGSLLFPALWRLHSCKLSYMGLCDILSAMCQASRSVITGSGNLQKLLESAQKSHFSEATEGTQAKQTKIGLGFNFLSNYVTQSPFWK